MLVGKIHYVVETLALRAQQLVAAAAVLALAVLAQRASPAAAGELPTDSFKCGAASGDAGFGTFTDTRVQAILPQAPAAGFSAEFFESITVPTLILGGTIDETTPFSTNQQLPYDSMLSGAAIVALAELEQTGHSSFSDFCEVAGDLLAFPGGADEACEPRHQPWRYAHDITKYVALNFFDAVLKGDAAALARLDAGVLAGFDNVRFESK